MYYSFSSVTFMRVFVRGLCIHSYVEIKELIHNPRLPILLRPPQVVTCSSAPDNSLQSEINEGLKLSEQYNRNYRSQVTYDRGQNCSVIGGVWAKEVTTIEATASVKVSTLA